MTEYYLEYWIVYASK